MDRLRELSGSPIPLTDLGFVLLGAIDYPSGRIWDHDFMIASASAQSAAGVKGGGRRSMTRRTRVDLESSVLPMALARAGSER
jgi:hypothetical protein